AEDDGPAGVLDDVVARAPLAGIAHHVEAAVGALAQRIRAHGRRPLEPVGLARAVAALLVAPPVVAPRVDAAVGPPRRLLPLLLGGEALPDPRRVGDRVEPADAHDGLARAAEGFVLIVAPVGGLVAARAGLRVLL